MDSAKLNDWMQVVGIFAVVASLIFVGLQMKQSQEIAIANQYQDRANAANEVLLAFMEGPLTLNARQSQFLLAELRSKGLSDELLEQIEEEGAENLSKQGLAISALMTLYDNNLFQYEAGFLDQASWLAFRVRMKSVLRGVPLTEQSLQGTQIGSGPSFELSSTMIIAELESERLN